MFIVKNIKQRKIYVAENNYLKKIQRQLKYIASIKYGAYFIY